MKKITNRELDRELERLGFKVARPGKPLRKHQKVCVLLGLAYPGFCFWLDMGTGKTRIVLELLYHYWKLGLLDRALILVPSEHALISAWEPQIKQWRIKMPFVTLGNGASAEKWHSVNELDSGLILATYPGIARMLSNKKPPRKSGKSKKAKKIKSKKAKKIKLSPDRKKMTALAKRLDAVIPDESTNLGNQASLIYRIVKRLSKDCEYIYPMAGRPFGRDPTMLWSQHYLVDKGESMGETLGLFRGALYNEKDGYFTRSEYTFRPEMRDKLNEMIGHRSISYAADECLDLPAVSRFVKHAELPEDAQGYYEKAVAQIKAARGDHIKINNLFLRMRQLSSGFIGYKDDETGDKAQLVFPVNPKLDLLMELIEEVPLDRKFVIFHDFIYSGALMSERLKSVGIKHERLWSGTKNTRKVFERFNTHPDVRGMIVNNRLGSMSLELQVANYEFMYESPVSVIAREQAERRCFRQGQKRPGFLFDLVATKTDQRILDFHKEGNDFLRALRRGSAGL